MTIDTKTLTLVANEMRNWRSRAGFMSDRLVAWADRIDAALATPEQRVEGWTIQVDSDGIWATDSDGSSVWLADAPTQEKGNA